MDKRLVVVSFLLGVALTSLGFMSYLYVNERSRNESVARPGPQDDRIQLHMGSKPLADKQMDNDRDDRRDKLRQENRDRVTRQRQADKDKQRGIQRFKNRPEDVDRMMEALQKNFEKRFQDNWHRDMDEEFLQMRQRMQKLFQDQALGGGLFGSIDDFGMDPSANITQREDDKNVYFELDLKNIDEETLEVNIQDGQVSISGRSVVKQEEQTPGGGYSSSTSTSSFSRSFPVPDGVDESGVTINKNGGKLQIRFPKKRS